MAAGYYTIHADRGSTFRLSFALRDDDGDPMNLTGYTARMHVRLAVDAADPPLLEMSTANGRIAIVAAEGKIDVTLPASATADVTWSLGVYDLEVTSSSGEVSNVLKGPFMLNKDVTR
jgi:hypothetical protein